jgi:hypothetical protein
MADLTGSAGQQIVQVQAVGAGTAGTPTGGVVTVQGANTAASAPINVQVSASAIDGSTISGVFGLDIFGNPRIAGVTSALWTGAAFALTRTPTIFKSFSAQLITSETTIWTPAAGKKFRLMGFVITQGIVAGNITLRDNTGGTTILVIPSTPIGQPLNVGIGMGNGILSAAANNVLTAQGTATETISGFLFGTEE